MLHSETPAVDEATILLCGAAATIGVVHTLLGPDHYLPFLAMSRAGGWSRRKTLAVTAACGVGHVLGSVLLGLVGIAIGAAVFKLETIESFRAEVAGWMLIAFGLAYTAWGLRRAHRRRPHRHWHTHAGGILHDHEHVHDHGHAHVHVHTADVGAKMTPWILFTILIFGPCEPLIPLLMYPAARGSIYSALVVAAVFGLATVATMLCVVILAGRAASLIRAARLERHAHTLAGAAVLACGLAVKLGL